MIQEEQTLRQLTGGQGTPFRVPDGYFEQFTDRLMQQIPQASQQKAKTVRLMPRLWRYAAALVFVAGIGSALYLNRSALPSPAYTSEATQEDYYNEALDYIMVDNMEIAEYLTEADY